VDGDMRMHLSHDLSTHGSPLSGARFDLDAKELNLVLRI
jgi:hypothetical protein